MSNNICLVELLHAPYTHQSRPVVFETILFNAFDDVVHIGDIHLAVIICVAINS